jgi:hypothetical protein
MREKDTTGITPAKSQNLARLLPGRRVRSSFSQLIFTPLVLPRSLGSLASVSEPSCIMHRFGGDFAGVLVLLGILSLSTAFAQQWVQECSLRGNLNCSCGLNCFRKMSSVFFSLANRNHSSWLANKITHEYHTLGTTCGNGNCLPSQPFFNCTLVRSGPFKKNRAACHPNLVSGSICRHSSSNAPF